MIKDYWEHQHKVNNKKALTGSTLQQYLQFFGLTDSFLQDKVILEIGVGMGIATRHLGILTDDLDVLDISEVAINKVSNWIVKGYLDPKELEDNMYDVAISHLVAQHMSNADLLNQLTHVIRALTPDGVLYIQWADANGDNGEDYDAQASGGVLRDMEEMERLVAQAGGVMHMITTKGINNNVQFYGARVRRK